MEYGKIFDLDGTLYKMRSNDATFGGSDFYADLKKGMHAFLQERLGITKTEAVSIYDRLKNKYDGSVSLGVETEYGINRYDWFEHTWDLPPEDYIDAAGDDLPELLAPFRNDSLILTSGPAVWANRALGHLGLANSFSHIITGEGDIRKPDERIFEHGARLLGRSCQHVISIGDQNKTDIAPARRLGMRTIRVGAAQEDAEFRVDTITSAVRIIRGLDAGIRAT